MTLLATVLIGALILGAAAWYGQMKISAPLSQLADRLRKEKQEQLFESWVLQLREVRDLQIDEGLAGL